jgi:hypothetical protein
VRRAILRSMTVAGLTLVVGMGAQLLYTVTWCSGQRAWERVHDHRSQIVLDSGYRFARPDESIYVCATPHQLGPIVYHQDLDCYCAPASLGPGALGRALSGDCVVDHAQATRADETGACRHAHCRDPDNWP